MIEHKLKNYSIHMDVFNWYFEKNYLSDF